MFNIRNLLFRGASATDFPEDVRAAREAWQAMPGVSPDEAHFHVRYVIVDVATSGPRAESDLLLGISAVAVQRGGRVMPDDALALDFSGQENDSAAVDRQLMSFLEFVGKSPVVVFHAPRVLGFLERVLKERLGVELGVPAIDLLWLMPALFDKQTREPLPLDRWLEVFELPSEGRRDAMANALMLARLFQRTLVAANARDLLTPAALVEECRASQSIRRHR